MDKEVIDFSYTAADYYKEISTQTYIRDFCNPECFIKYCRKCGNYGKLWVCPPFSYNTIADIEKYSKVLLIVTKIIPKSEKIPISHIHEFIRPERLRIEMKLREMERLHGGRAFAFAGSCMYCEPGTCSRLRNQPCRHPGLARPSLEAYGFDLGRTTSELFGIEMLWSSNNFIPEYLTLVSGFFHNNPTIIF